MDLDCLFPESPEIPLIRLFNFTTEEVSNLQAAVAGLATGKVDQVAVHAFPGIVSVDHTELVLSIQSWDQGLLTLDLETNKFCCLFSCGTWDNVSGLIEPFCAGRSGFQWLVGGAGTASILLSHSGEW